MAYLRADDTGVFATDIGEYCPADGSRPPRSHRAIYDTRGTEGQPEAHLQPAGLTGREGRQSHGRNTAALDKVIGAPGYR